MQEAVWLISLALMGAVALAFVVVTAGASRPAIDGVAVAHIAYRWRSRLLWVALILGAAISVLSLWTWPFAGHVSTSPKADVTIRAEARQWSWHLDRDSVRVGELVEFVVTSSDVNHGFAVYRDKTHLVAQTQAMPGYENKLRIRFTDPGEYEVLCLEYCGVGHHMMRAVIKVTSS